MTTYTTEQIATLLAAYKRVVPIRVHGNTPAATQFIIAAPAIVAQQADRIKELETEIDHVQRELLRIYQYADGYKLGRSMFAPYPSLEGVSRLARGEYLRSRLVYVALGGDA